MFKSFSLIEVLVTIAIVALLSAMAMPVYLQYTNKAKVTQAAQVLAILNNAATAAFNDGALGSSFSYNSVSLSNTSAAFAYSPVVRAQYKSPTTLGSPNEWAFCVFVAGLNFSGYVEPTSGSDGTYGRLCAQVQQNSGVYTTNCGAWDGTNADIPTKYLPSQCNCASVSTGSC